MCPAAQAEPPTAIVVEIAAEGLPMTPEALKAAIAEEVGLPIVASTGPRTGTLVVAADGRGGVVMRYVSPPIVLERAIDLPEHPGDRLQSVAFLARNLVSEEPLSDGPPPTRAAAATEAEEEPEAEEELVRNVTAPVPAATEATGLPPTGPGPIGADVAAPSNVVGSFYLRDGWSTATGVGLGLGMPLDEGTGVSVWQDVRWRRFDLTLGVDAAYGRLDGRVGSPLGGEVRRFTGYALTFPLTLSYRLVSSDDVYLSLGAFGGIATLGVANDSESAFSGSDIVGVGGIALEFGVRVGRTHGFVARMLWDALRSDEVAISMGEETAFVVPFAPRLVVGWQFGIE